MITTTALQNNNLVRFFFFFSLFCNSSARAHGKPINSTKYRVMVESIFENGTTTRTQRCNNIYKELLFWVKIFIILNFTIFIFFLALLARQKRVETIRNGIPIQCRGSAKPSVTNGHQIGFQTYSSLIVSKFMNKL